MFYQNDAYGQAGLKGVERAMEKRNLEDRRRSARSSATPSRSRTRWRRSAGRSPQAVVMISAYKSCAEFIRQMKQAGIRTF